jgi:hypothetical protein
MTMSNGSFLYVNPDHVMFVAHAQKDGVPVVNQTAVKLIDGVIAVDGMPDDVAALLNGEG